MSPARPLSILSFTAHGVAAPHALRDIQDALARHGHQVQVQDIAALPGYYEQVVAITDALVTVEPEAVVTLDHIGLVPQVLPLLARRPRVISWFFDNPLNFLTPDHLSLEPLYDIFCWDEHYVPRLREMGFTRVTHQPFATNPRVYRPEPGSGFDYDISFVGSFSPARRDVLGELGQRGLTIHVFGGEEWRLNAGRGIVFHGAADNRRDCPRIYSRSKINLNITNPQLVTALPMRVFDVLACGGFLLTDDKPAAHALFQPGRELAIYRDTADLAHQISHYLAHDEERRAIGLAGYHRVLAAHTFDLVAPRLLAGVLAARDAVPLPRLAPDQAARGLWLTGLAYLKQGRLEPAYPRIMEALRLGPADAKMLVAAAALAACAEQPGALRSCRESLERLGSDWAPLVAGWSGPDALRHPPDTWARMYRMMYPDLAVQPDGHIAGWQPRPGAG